MSLVLENGQAGERLALEVFEARTATGRDVPEGIVGEPELADRSSGVATAEWSNFIEQEKASNEIPIDPRRAIKELRAAASADTLMITDTGNHQTWVEQYWDAPGPQMVFTPGGFAGMGFGT